MHEREALVEKLVAGDRTRNGGSDVLSHAFLRSVVEFAASYARIEKLLFGGTRILYSESALGLDLSLEGDVMAQGEKLAEAERARFDLPAGPILELGYLIEDQGLKIIPRAFPPGSAARGSFFFDSALGPCILLNVRASRPEIDYALVHQYGHYLADYDPYITTICGRPAPETLQDPRELRAHQFALAYLMPRADLELYRDAMGLEPGGSITVEFVRQLQVYFDVDYEMVFWRLLSLGWIDPRQIETLLGSEPVLFRELRGPAPDPGPGPLVPERYIHFVASAFGRKKIEIEKAADFLGTDVEGAKRILDQFQYEERAAAKPAARKPGLATGTPPASNPATPPPNPN